MVEMRVAHEDVVDLGEPLERKVAHPRARVDQDVLVDQQRRGAQAATDALMHSEILTYSRSRGLFAGISLDGSTLRADNSATEKVYGRKVSARDIVLGHKVGTPGAGQLMVSTLQKASPTNKSDPKSLQK